MGRNRKILSSTVTSIVGKVISIGVSLISVPLTLDYLGTERYGIWMSATSIVALLAFADLGIGNGLLNALAHASGKDDHMSARRYISTALIIFFFLAIVLGLLSLVGYRFIDWRLLFNLPSGINSTEVAGMTLMLCLLTAVNIPLGVSYRIYLGYQEGYKANFQLMIGSLISFLGVLICVEYKAKLFFLALAFSGGQTLALLYGTYNVFFKNYKWIQPRIKLFDWKISRELVRTGLFFLILQTMAILGSASDNLVIAQIMGQEEVSTYAVVQRLFSTVVITQYITMALWPAFNEAISRGDFSWAKKTLKKMLLLAFWSSLLIGILMILFGSDLILIWTGSKINPPFLLIVAFSINIFITSYGGIMSALLNSGSTVKGQVIFFSIASLISIVLKIFFTKEIGISGPIFATTIAYSIFYAYPAWRLAKLKLNQS